MIPNAPPVMTHGVHIDDLYDQAKDIMDGKVEPTTATDADATLVAKLLDEARKAERAADESRKDEKRPLDDQIAVIQGGYNPLLEKCRRIIATTKAWQTRFLTAKEAAQRAEAEKARIAAEEAQRAAQERLRATQPTDLAAREEAERELQVADALGKTATKLGKAKAHAIGGSRATALRSYWIATLVDPTAALKHYREHQPEALKAWLVEQGQRDANAGARAIPGFAVKEDRRAA